MEHKKKKIWLSSPHIGKQELRFVKEAFSSNWIAPLGPHVDAFECEIADYLGEQSMVAVLSSGTAAIHLALILLGVVAGDEVICQSMTFSATANPIVYQGATPVFVDSEPDTWNMSPVFLENAILERIKKGVKPKAIIAVHLYGVPAKMDEIMQIGHKYAIPVIEDAAEALGSLYTGKKCGTIGDIGILSFNGNKIITTSGGGAIVSKNLEWVEKAKFLSTQARDKAPHYQHSQLGYNYRLSNVLAGIGRGQMQVLDERVSQRRANFEFYKNAFAGFEGLSFLDEPDRCFSNRWLTTILVDISKSKNQVSPEQIRIALEKENIESRPLWKPMHLQPLFGNSVYFGQSISDNLFKYGLCLPSGSNLTSANLKSVARTVNALR